MGTLHSKSLGKSGKQNWSTPRWFLKVLLTLLGYPAFSLDPCCDGPVNACGEKFFTPKQNGLKQKWFGHVFVNPPWNDIGSWVEKAKRELNNVDSITFLLPNKPETKWFEQLWQLNPTVYIVAPRLNYYDTTRGKLVSGIAFTSIVVEISKDSLKESPKVMLLKAKRSKEEKR